MNDNSTRQFPIERNHFTQLLILWLVAATFLTAVFEPSGILLTVPLVASLCILTFLPLYAVALAMSNVESSQGPSDTKP